MSAYLAGKTAELMVAGLHGNLYTATYRGMMFHGYNTTASAIPITSTTAPTFILWNPYGSGVNCVLVHYVVGYAAGTNVEGNVQLAVIQGAGAMVATGAPITAFTDGPTLNGNVGSGDNVEGSIRNGCHGSCCNEVSPNGNKPHADGSD